MKTVMIKVYEPWSATITFEEWGVNTENEGLFVREQNGIWRQCTRQFRATSPKEFMFKLRNGYLNGNQISMILNSESGWGNY